MKRREFITLLGGAAAAWPHGGRAQQREKIRRVGILMPAAKGDAEIEARVSAFRQELEKLGWIEGDNIQFDERWTMDNMDLIRANAASLMHSNPDVVVANGGRVIPVLLQISRSIPIVIPGVSDPVRIGWAESLARPGGNVTGFTFFEHSILGKMLEILKQLSPTTARVGMIFNPDNPVSVFFRGSFEKFAGEVGVQPIIIPVHALSDIERATAGLTEQNAAVLFVPDLTTITLREQIIALLKERRLPAIYWDSVFTKTGGLASYGPDRTDLFRKAAGYVHRILRGEKPADLPFEQPTKYQLVINLTTAKALGIEVPPTVLTLADEIIE